MDKKSAEILDKLWIEFYMRGEQHEKENRKNDFIDRGLCFLSLAVCACGKTVKAVDSRPNLEGDIKELKDGQLTVVEAITEKSDNGGDIVVSPGSGDDSEYNKIAVTYDENTLFAIKTIYDGGARFEMSAATAADLASGQFIQVWGSSSGSGLKATQICIVKVA